MLRIHAFMSPQPLAITGANNLWHSPLADGFYFWDVGSIDAPSYIPKGSSGQSPGFRMPCPVGNVIIRNQSDLFKE